MLGARLAKWLDAGEAVVLVTVTSAQGSTPREVGVRMGISAGSICGTIGGGALEALAIREARSLLNSEGQSLDIDQPLGPEIGQCCGGRAQLHIAKLDSDAITTLQGAEAKMEANQPHVLIFGAGHTGGALATALAPLPLDVTVIDERSDWLAMLSSTVKPVQTALPEAEVAAAPPGAAFVIMTHDHALDFLIAEAALARNDAAYVGMIGSATKRARLVSDLTRKGVSASGLTCPIGALGPKDKRPEVIAAITAAEVMAALL